MNSRALWSIFFALVAAVSARAQLFDNQPPSVQIRTPGNVARIPGGTNTVEVTGTAKDNGAVARVEVQLDGGTPHVAVLSGSNPRFVSWRVTLTVTDGPHTLDVTATDDFGLTGTRSKNFRVQRVCQITVGVDPNGKGSVNRPTAAIAVLSTQTYTAQLVRGSGFMFDHWELDGVPIGATPTISFVVPNVAAKTLTAKFSPNPYAPLAGIYNDRLLNSGGTGEGFYTLTLTTEGTFTLALAANGVSLRAKGAIDFSGLATLAKTGMNPASVTVEAYLAGGGGVRIDCVRTALGAHYTADTTLYPRVLAPIPLRGTVVLSPGPRLPPELRGSGFAALAAAANGRYSIRGRLADGTAWSASVLPIDHGSAAFPIFRRLTGGVVLDGEIVWDVGADAISGELAWQRPEWPRALFSAALNGSLTVHGKSFTRPPRGLLVSPAGPAGTGSIDILGSGAAVVSGSFHLTPRHIADFGPVNPENLALKLNAASGVYAGKWTDAVSGRKRKFAGVLVQETVADAAGDHALGTGYAVEPDAVDRVEVKLFTSP